MTATPPSAPDTRPRCGGTPGKPGHLIRQSTFGAYTEHCPGCADCAQPVPTPSGDAARGPRHKRAVTASVANAYLDEMERLAAALQEARERAEAWKANFLAMKEEAEAAEARLREVEGELQRVLTLVGSAEADVSIAARFAADPETWLDSAIETLREAATSRPVPAAPAPSAFEELAQKARAATPSTDEEGRA